MSNRIPLILDEKGYVIVRTFIWARKYHVHGAVKFYVDTGSPESFISEQDALRLGFPLNKLNYDKKSLMAGTKIETAPIKNVILTFGDGKKIPMIEFRVSRNMRRGKKSVSVNNSILGIDFLVKNKLSLHVNPVKKEAYYEHEA